MERRVEGKGEIGREKGKGMECVSGKERGRRTSHECDTQWKEKRGRGC